MKCKHDWKLFASSTMGDYIFYCKKCDSYKEFKKICLECFICGMKIDYNGKETKCYCENEYKEIKKTK